MDYRSSTGELNAIDGGNGNGAARVWRSSARRRSTPHSRRCPRKPHSSSAQKNGYYYYYWRAERGLGRFFLFVVGLGFYKTLIIVRVIVFQQGCIDNVNLYTLGFSVGVGR